QAGAAVMPRTLPAVGPFPYTTLFRSDREAALIEAAASRRGLDVPGQLAVVSYDDELAEIAEVPLTAMSPAKFHLGAAAAEVMLRRLEDGRSSPVLQLKLRPRLVVRDSCGASALARPPGG